MIGLPRVVGVWRITMKAGEASRRIAVLIALALFVLVYGVVPAFAGQGGGKAQKAKAAPGVQKSAAGQERALENVTVPGTPLGTQGEAAGMAPPERPPVPESQRSPEMFDRPEGEASSGQVEPPGPVPSGPGPKAGIIGDTGTEAMMGTIQDRGPTTPTGPPPKNRIRATERVRTSAGEVVPGADGGTAGTAGSPPIPDSEGQPAPRPPRPVEAPPVN